MLTTLGRGWGFLGSLRCVEPVVVGAVVVVVLGDSFVERMVVVAVVVLGDSLAGRVVVVAVVVLGDSFVERMVVVAVVVLGVGFVERMVVVVTAKGRENKLLRTRGDKH